MAHYSSNSHLWSDPLFLKLGRLERIIILYLLHGPGRSNVAGIVEDSAVQMADRLAEPVEDIRAALARMAEDPLVLQVDAERRLIRSPLVARMDPHCGGRNIVGWYKNWSHLPEAPLKYAHIESLQEKIDTTKPEQVRLWNQTFGAELDGQYGLGATPPAQLRLIHSAPPTPPAAGASHSAPRRGVGKHQPRHQETVKQAGLLPGRESVEHIEAKYYVEHYAPDLLRSGVVGAMGASEEMFALAMHAVATKCPGHKRPTEWDLTALNYVETQITIASNAGDGHGTRGTTHDHHRGGQPGPRRTKGTRARGAAEDHSAGQWSEVVHRKAAEPSIFSDP